MRRLDDFEALDKYLPSSTAGGHQTFRSRTVGSSFSPRPKANRISWSHSYPAVQAVEHRQLAERRVQVGGGRGEPPRRHGRREPEVAE